jgi:hypothetical protein
MTATAFLRARLAPLLVNHAGRLILVIGAVMLVVYISATEVLRKPNGRVVFGDATHHFVQLRSLVFDHDVDLQNDYMRIYGLTKYEPETDWIFYDHTPTGKVRNYMPVGPALLWAPLYLLVVFGQTALAHLGLASPPDGFDHVLQVVPGVTGVIAGTLAARLSWQIAGRFASPTSAAIGALGMWLGSNALYYSLVSPSYSHTASMFACSLFFWHWLRSDAPWSPARAAVSGAAAGLATLMRWQDGLLLAIPLFECMRAPLPARTRVFAAGAAAGAWLVVFLPQMFVWHSLYGRWLTMPQGGSFMQWTSAHPLAVLFDKHGWFTWTPIVVIGLAGLVSFGWRHTRVALPIAFVVLSAWYVNSAVADWWAGEAFGARRFLSLFPLLVLGLAVWLDAGRATWRMTVVVTLVALNWLLLFQYELFMKGLVDLSAYPEGAFNLWIARFLVPVKLIARWLS